MKMVLVTRGLVIDGHWVSLILTGRKTWEMRSQATNIRGSIALIRKGTGKVWGVANLIDCLAPLSIDLMMDNIEKHQIPEHMIRSGEVEKWRFPWVLEDPVSFIDPVPYEHPNGAVIWVQLDYAISHEIDQRLRNSGQRFVEEAEPQGRNRPKTTRDRATPLSQMLAPITEAKVERRYSASSPATANIIGRTTITEGNFKNNHIYLRGFFEKFPSDAVGGSNRSALASASVKVRWEGSEWHETDLDGQKLFFRSRSMVRKFFEESGAEVGDIVEIEQTDPYYFQLRLQKRSV